MLPWSKIVGRGKISYILKTVDSVGLTDRLNVGKGRGGSFPTGTSGLIVVSFIDRECGKSRKSDEANN